MKKLPAQAYILLLVLGLHYWPWQLFSGDIGWLVTVITIPFCVLVVCNKLTHENWATAVIIVEVACMLINATLFAFGLHKIPMREHIMLSGFIIELLLITMSMGAGIGRIRNDRLHDHINSVDSFFNCSRSGYRVAEASQCEMR
jgi:hypothetical protein